MIAVVHNPNGYNYFYDARIGTRKAGTRWGEVWPHTDGSAHTTTTGMYIRDRRAEFPTVQEAEWHVRVWIVTGQR